MTLHVTRDFVTTRPFRPLRTWMLLEMRRCPYCPTVSLVRWSAWAMTHDEWHDLCTHYQCPECHRDWCMVFDWVTEMKGRLPEWLWPQNVEKVMAWEARGYRDERGRFSKFPGLKPA